MHVLYWIVVDVVGLYALTKDIDHQEESIHVNDILQSDFHRCSY